MKNKPPISAQTGFTAIEMLITIAVLAILLGLAVPSFSAFLTRNRLTSQINALVADISYARNESITRGTRVTMCVSPNGATCAIGPTGWEQGRIIFVDTNGDGVVQAGETVLKVSQPLGGGSTLAIAGFPNPTYIQFRPYGGLNPATAGTFKLCSPSSATGRRVSVAATGRPLASQVSCP